MRKKEIFRVAVSVLFFAIIGGCSPVIQVEEPHAGTLDFTRVVAIGGSYTAGFRDGALYQEGQLSAFPNIMATQFDIIMPTNFEQPLIKSSTGVYFGENGVSGKYIADYSPDCKGAHVLTANRTQPVDFDINSLEVREGIPYNNFGIPDISLRDYLSSRIKYNPYYKRFVSGRYNSLLEEIIDDPPTFFILWIGFEDFQQALKKGSMLPGEITVDLLDKVVRTYIDTLKKYGGEGVMLNIPDITLTAATSLAAEWQFELSATEASQLNSAMGVHIEIFHQGVNQLVITDYSGNIRQALPDELLLNTLPRDSILCGGWGKTVPIPSEYVLDKDELASLRQAVESFNKKLQEIAREENVVLVAMDELIQSVHEGMMIDGVKITNQPFTGNFYSLDGITPTAMGQAIIANTVIETINSHYQARIPLVRISHFPSNSLP